MLCRVYFNVVFFYLFFFIFFYFFYVGIFILMCEKDSSFSYRLVMLLIHCLPESFIVYQSYSLCVRVIHCSSELLIGSV